MKFSRLTGPRTLATARQGSGGHCLYWLLLLLMGWTPLCVQAQEKPDLYLLAIGVSEYSDPTLPDLQYADDDAAALVAWALSQSGHLYAKVHVRVLTNAEASRPQVVQTILDHFSPARPNDQLILFLSGHGKVEERTQAWHYLTADSELEKLAGTALEQSFILRQLEMRGQSNRVLVLVDTCQSGALAKASSKDGRGLFVSSDVQPISDDVANARTGMWVIFTAGTSIDIAVEGPQYRLPGEPETVQGHGLFTWALLRGLEGGAADRDGNGIVTLNELQIFVSNEVRIASNGKQITMFSGRLTDTGIGFVQGTVEKCDGLDNNMDGKVDEGFDKNANGLGDCMESEKCNGVDDNGDGQVDEGFDLDGDGYRDRELCGLTFGSDCDDKNIAIHPDQKDWGNLRDDDCDGRVDEEAPSSHWNPTIPDNIEQQYRLKRAQGFGALGGGVLFLGVAVVQWYQLERGIAEAPREGVISKPERKAVTRHLVSGVGLTGASFLSLGFSGTFFWEAHRIKLELYPPVRM